MRGEGRGSASKAWAPPGPCLLQFPPAADQGTPRWLQHQGTPHEPAGHLPRARLKIQTFLKSLSIETLGEGSPGTRQPHLSLALKPHLNFVCWIILFGAWLAGG